MGTVTQQLGGFERTSKRVGNVVKGMFAAFAVGQVVGGLKDVVKHASDAEQSLGATKTIFGQYADTVVKDSKKAAMAFGLSANEYRENTNLIGAMLSNQGVSADKLAGKTKKLVGVAADLSATYGGETKDSLAAISAAYRGEYEQMERYGVTMKQSTVNTEAETLAKKKYGKELKNLSEKQQTALKQQATGNIIDKQTAKTRGAFAKETDTLAHQQQVLGAQFDNLKVTLGTALLPVFTSVLKFINDRFLPATKAIGDFIAPVIARFKEFFSAGGSGTSALQPLIEFFNGKMVPAFQKIVEAASGMWEAIRPILEQVAAAFMDKWGEIGPKVTAIFESIKGIIISVMELIAQYITVYTTVISFIWSKWGATILAFVTTTFSNVASFIGGILEVIRGVINTVLSVLRGDWAGAWAGIKQILSGAWTAIKALVRQSVNIVKTVITAAWIAVKAVTSAIWAGIKAAVSAGISGMLGVVRGIKGKILGAFAGAAGWLTGIGRNIIDGLANGIEAGRQWVMSKVRAIADEIPGWLKKRLGIASPSRVMRRLAKWIPAGIALGIQDGSKGVKKAMDKINKTIVKEAKKGKINSKRISAALKSTKDERAALMRTSRAYDKVSARLKDARKNLADLKKQRDDYAASVRNNALEYGSVMNLNTAFSADAMLQQMRARIAKVKEYSNLLARLRSQGLNSTMYDQLVQAGVEGGLATANAIAEGGPAAIKEFNSLQAQLGTAASTLGNTAANNMYNAGIQAAQGLVNGLNKKAKALEKASKRLANAMVKQIKKALGIKSPSRVFKRLGEYTVQGMEIGLQDTSGIKQGMTNLSRVMTNSFDPVLATKATAQNANTGGNVTVQVNVPPTADKAAIGRELQSALDAYYKNGGRRVA